MLSSVSYAEDWKWEKAFNSVVLVSGENVAENIIDTPFNEPPPPESGPHDKPNTDSNSIQPKIIPYGMGTGFFINKMHIITNYHVIKEFNKLTLYAFNHPYEITDVEIIGYDEEIDIAVLQVNEENLDVDYLNFAYKLQMIDDDVN